MKKRLITALMISCSIMGMLSSCTNDVEGKAYGIIKGTTVVMADEVVSGGKLKSLSFNATVTPAVWGKLDMDALKADGKDTALDYVKVELDDVTYYYPASINLGGYILNGTRGGDNDGVGDYVDYVSADTKESPLKEATLFTYINTADANGNTGSKAGWYYNCVVNGYGHTSKSSEGKDVLDGIAALNKDGTVLDSKYLNLSAPLFVRDEQYTGSVAGITKDVWLTNITAMESYFPGHILYSTGAKVKPTYEKGDDGVWTMIFDEDTEDDDPGTTEVITGVTFIQFRLYYMIAAYAFAAVEYNSYGLL